MGPTEEHHQISCDFENKSTKIQMEDTAEDDIIPCLRIVMVTPNLIVDLGMSIQPFDDGPHPTKTH